MQFHSGFCRNPLLELLLRELAPLVTSGQYAQRPVIGSALVERYADGEHLFKHRTRRFNVHDTHFR